jgi:hypothetical protein
MAGLGRKVFTAGEVLTAANVQGFLMDQTTMVFDTSAARGSAIAAPTEGMVTYLKDTNELSFFDGAAFVAIGGDPAFTSSTATAFTVQSSDAGSFLRFTNAGTVTIGTATAFSAGQQVQILADGASLAVTSGSGVTLGGAGTAGTALTFNVGGQFEALSVFCVAADEYRVIGNVTSA